MTMISDLNKGLDVKLADGVDVQCMLAIWLSDETFAALTNGAPNRHLFACLPRVAGASGLARVEFHEGRGKQLQLFVRPSMVNQTMLEEIKQIIEEALVLKGQA